MRLSIALQNSPPFRLLFCHGLGSAKADAKLVQEWAETKAELLQFQMVRYREYGVAERPTRKPWTVDSWERDVSAELEGQQQKKQLQQRTICVCISAGAQAFLRAIWRVPSLLQGIAGLLMVSPGVGMEVDNYIRRVLPEHAELLKRGLVVEHPSTDPRVRIGIDLASLEDYQRNCVTRLDQPLPTFDFPVRIVHGIYDKLVPFQNSVDLLNRIRARNKGLFLVNSGHLISDRSTLIHSLDTLWEAVPLTGKDCQRQQKAGFEEESRKLAMKF